MSDITAVPIPSTRRGILVLLWIGIALAIALGAWVAFAGQAPANSVTAYLAKNARQNGVKQTQSGLQYKELRAGSGAAKPTDADVTLVNYEGKLTNGTTFDKSQQPTPMPVAGVVPGFSEALKLMTKGSKYRFWLKPSLGYGDKAAGPIPANSVLVFDVELLDFLPEQRQALPRQALRVLALRRHARSAGRRRQVWLDLSCSTAPVANSVAKACYPRAHKNWWVLPAPRA